jgi:hypothetical protein
LSDERRAYGEKYLQRFGIHSAGDYDNLVALEREAHEARRFTPEAGAVFLPRSFSLARSRAFPRLRTFAHIKRVPH